MEKLFVSQTNSVCLPDPDPFSAFFMENFAVCGRRRGRCPRPARGRVPLSPIRGLRRISIIVSHPSSHKQPRYLRDCEAPDNSCAGRQQERRQRPLPAACFLPDGQQRGRARPVHERKQHSAYRCAPGPAVFPEELRQRRERQFSQAPCDM